MEYAKLQLVDLRSPAWRSASMRARGAAVTVVAYCADQENRGRIAGARSWSSKRWHDVVGLTRSDLDAAVAAELCAWSGDDLVAILYDLHAQETLETKRAQGDVERERQRKIRENRSAPDPMGTPMGTPMGHHAGTPHSIPSHSIPDQTRTTPPHASPAAPAADAPQPSAKSHDDIDIHLAPWVRVDVKDPKRTADNHATLVSLVAEHGEKAVQAAAEAFRHREARKAYPDELIAPLAELARGDSEVDVDPHVTAIRAAIARHGWQRVVEASGIPVDRVRDGDQAADILTRYNRPGGERALAKLGGAAASGAA